MTARELTTRPAPPDRHQLAGRQHVAASWLWSVVLGMCAFTALCVERAGKMEGPASEALPREAPVLASRLLAIESGLSRVWNSSRTALLLGHKARRDFNVYSWAFRARNFRIGKPDDGTIFLRGEEQLAGIGALLCHSILTFNCFRDKYNRQEPDLFSSIGRGRKVSRIASVRAVLTTKDGFCETLRSTRLAEGELDAFAFPCWSLPVDLGALRAAANTTLASSVWIVKPKRGSMGIGIRVLEPQQLGQFLSQPSLVNFVVQPYLSQPLLQRGRKWDVRTYVLVTSVLPMRVYLFTEAIVRYASAKYSPASREPGAVLTNTFVGKRVLHSGVRDITGSLNGLCPIFAEEGENCAPLLLAMRTAIGKLFLASEPRFSHLYGEHGFRCAGCYHLFGVDLIADSSRRFRVIEVNVAPDLTLSTEGACNSSGTKCEWGSTPYDHTKRAVAFNTVQLVYSGAAVAKHLTRTLEAHAEKILSRFPNLLSQRNTGRRDLQDWVLEYLLETARERRGLGCYTSVYPSVVHHNEFGSHLRSLRDGARACSSHAACDAAKQFWDDRSAVHELMLLLHLPGDSGGLPQPRWMQPYRERCEQMLRQVHEIAFAHGDRNGDFAQRNHIFGALSDLEE